MVGPDGALCCGLYAGGPLTVPGCEVPGCGVPVKCGRTPNLSWGSSTVNGVPAVTYSPTPSRVQYHRRCGS